MRLQSDTKRFSLSKIKFYRRERSYLISSELCFNRVVIRGLVARVFNIMSKIIRFLKNTLKSFGPLIRLHVYLDKKMKVPLVVITIMLEHRAIWHLTIFRSKNIFEPALEAQCGESSFKLHSESNKRCSGDSLFVTF